MDSCHCMSGMTSSAVTSGMTGKEGRLSARTDPLWIKTEMRSRQVGKKKELSRLVTWENPWRYVYPGFGTRAAG